MESVLEQLFGSKARAAIIERLFVAEPKRMHLRELARACGLSAPNVLRTAKSLSSLGVLLEESDGNQTLFSANRESPFYESLKQMAARAADPVPMLAAAFSGKEADVAFVYGSRAAGTARPDSDCDVFVIGGGGLRRITALLASVRERVSVELNPYVLNASEFRRRMNASDHFLGEVMASPKIFLKGDENELETMARQRLA